MTQNAIISAVHNSPYDNTACDDGYHHVIVRFDDGSECAAWSPVSMEIGNRVIVDISTPTPERRTEYLRYGVTLPDRECVIMDRLMF